MNYSYLEKAQTGYPEEEEDNSEKGEDLQDQSHGISSYCLR